MVEYLIIAVAFATMIHFRYIMETLGIVKGALYLLDLEDDYKKEFSPIAFSIVFFLFNFISMPIVSFYFLFEKREKVLKDISSTILKSFFQLEEK